MGSATGDKLDQLQILNSILRHDIRNDAQVIIGLTDLLRDEAEGETRELLDTIRNASNHIIELSVSVKDLVELITSEQDIELNAVNFNEIMDQEVKQARIYYKNAEIQSNHTSDEPVYVEANSMLSSVIRNLLSNAVRHNEKDTPKIVIDTEIKNSKLHFSVADNGPGIEEEYKEKVFNKNFQGLESEGGGIGLYLINLLVKQYEGNIWVENNQPTGAVFHVELNVADSQ